ncbi:MAG: TRAP transporter small permease [Succinivibrio sp.]|nr:TRAP transporter small permease [Succinivibrio sp.]
MQSFFEKFGRFYRLVCVLILTAMVLIVFINAVMRYAFHSGLVVTEELLRYLFIYLTFLGMVEVAHERGHIAVTILSDALPKAVRTALHVVGYVLAIYALWILFDGSLEYYAESDTSIGQVTGIPYQYIVAIMIFGAFGVLLFLCRDLILALRALFVTHEEFPPRYVDEDLKQFNEQQKREKNAGKEE